MAVAFLDTNVLLRHLLHDAPEQSARATACVERIQRRELRVWISDTVVFEVVFTLQRFYGIERAEIREAPLPIVGPPGIALPGKRRLRRAFDLYVDLNLPFADAYHVALAERLGLDPLISFDRGFDRVPGIRREEP